MELPQDFKERIRYQLGDFCTDFLACYEKERVCGLRYNPLKIGKEELKQLLLARDIITEPVSWAKEGFYYPADAHPGRMALHEAGAFYIQEPSAMVAVELLDPKPGETILDLCAAPGGKSTQIAGRMQGEGLLISNEVIPQRARTLSRNIERMGIRNAVVLNESPKRLAGQFLLFFDRILVDAPCSGEGMFRKDPDARGEWSLRQVQACAERQREILAQAAAMLKPGGVLVYSTCTFAPQENEQMAEWFVQEYPQFLMEKSTQLWPHLARGEGHYAARFRKRGCGSVGNPEASGREIPEQKSAQKTAGLCKKPEGRASRKAGSFSREQSSRKAGSFSREQSSRKAGSLRKEQSSRKAGSFSREQSSRKAGSLRKEQSGRKTGSFSREQTGQEFLEFCKETLADHMQEWVSAQIAAGRIQQSGAQLCLLPPGIRSLEGLKTERAGLQLGCCKKHRFEPSHALAMALHPDEVRRTLELEEPERFLRGETVRAAQQTGWILATVNGCSIGWGKASQGVLKNHYPKGLRRF